MATRRLKVKLGSTVASGIKPGGKGRKDAPNAPNRVHHPDASKPAPPTAKNAKRTNVRQRTASVSESSQITKDDLVEYIAKLLMGGYRKAQIRAAIRELIVHHDPTHDTSRPLDVFRIDTMIAEAQRNLKRYSELDLRSLKKIAVDTLLGGTADDRVDFRSKAYGVSVLSEVLDLKNVSLVDEDDVAAIATQAQEEIESDHALDRDAIARLQVEAEEALEKAKAERLRRQKDDDD